MDSEPLLRVTESFLGGMTHSLVLRKSQSKLVAAGFYARVPHSSPGAPSSGQPLAALLRAALEPFCKHRDLVDRHRGVPYSLRGCPRLSIRAHGSHSGNVECFLVRSVEGATYGEIGASFPVGNEIVKTSERLAVLEAICQDFAFRGQDADHRQLPATRAEGFTGIGTRP